MPSKPRRVGIPAAEIRFHLREDGIIIEQPIELASSGSISTLSLGTNSSKRFMGSYLSTIMVTEPPVESGCLGKRILTQEALFAPQTSTKYIHVITAGLEPRIESTSRGRRL